MQEGIVQTWMKKEGDDICEGEELVDVETSKITNVVEAPFAGRVVRIVAQPGETLPVGGLLAVVADGPAAAAEIDAFIADFQARFVPETEDEAEAVAARLVEIAPGQAIRTLTMGEGAPALVLLHGFGGDLENWAAVQPALAAKRRVIAVDLPGHGGSTKHVGAATPEALAAMIAAALDAMGEGQVHLAGHSLGGAVALALALHRPEAVKSLVLLCPAALPGTTLNAGFIEGFLNAKRARDLARALEPLFADPARAGRDLAEQILKSKRLDGVEEALTAIASAMAAPAFAALGARIGAVTRPVSVVATEDDRIVGRPDAERLPPGARLVVLQGASHMPHAEEPARVIEVINAALA
jgi:pyruvate dehydrogenase E2 component (dihydrolipoamide acetyltransferase)